MISLPVVVLVWTVDELIPNEDDIPLAFQFFKDLRVFHRKPLVSLLPAVDLRHYHFDFNMAPLDKIIDRNLQAATCEELLVSISEKNINSDVSDVEILLFANYSSEQRSIIISYSEKTHR